MFIRHLSGSKAGATEHFAISGHVALNIGCSTACDLRFSADSDRFVSGMHACIESAPGPPGRFRISDLGSTNGTFVNGAPVRSWTDLRSGDIIRVGRGGPEFVFDLQPNSGARGDDIGPMPGTVVAGMRTFARGFVSYDEKRSAVGLFVRVLRSPVRETMRIALQGDGTNPFAFMALAYAFYAITGRESSVLNLAALFPVLAQEGKWLNEIFDIMGLLFVSMLSIFMQYRFLSRVSPERRRFREFLALSSVMTGILYALLGVGQVLTFMVDGWALLVFIPSMGYWIIQSLRIVKEFWRMSYPRLMWYGVISTLAATVVMLVVFVAIGVLVAGIAIALGQPLPE